MKATTIDAHTPVLALHCSLGSGAQWRSLTSAMAERQVIALDLLGYGAAPAPASEDDFTLDAEVDAIEQALGRRLSAGQPLHVVGHSYGGAVAWRFALRNQSRVRSLTLFEPVAVWLVQHDVEAQPFLSLAKQIADAVNLGLRTEAAERFVDFWSGAGTFASLPEERRSSIANRMHKVKLDFLACLSERSGLPSPKQMRMPALLMNGSEAFGFARATIRALQTVFVNCVTAEVQGGHMAPVENRAQVDTMIAAFIRSCDREAASAELLVA